MAEVPNPLTALIARATESLGVEASEDACNRIKDRLQAVAAELALEWIVGDRRFETQSQQTEYWLGRLYEEIYPDEQPEATRIYTRFGLPLPRSQYLARLLLARRITQWRAAAQQEVRSALEAKEADSLTARKAKADKTQTFDLSLSKGGYDQLVVFYDQMAREMTGGDRPAPPRRSSSSPAIAWFSLTAETVLDVLKFLRGGKG